MLYGAAHPAGQTLASIRRAMNYFKGSSTGTETADFVCFPCVLTSTAAGIAVQHLDTGKKMRFAFCGKIGLRV